MSLQDAASSILFIGDRKRVQDWQGRGWQTGPMHSMEDWWRPAPPTNMPPQDGSEAKVRTVDSMAQRLFHQCRQFLVAALIAFYSFASGSAAAVNAPHSNALPSNAPQPSAAHITAPQLSASYNVLERTNLGAEQQIRLRIHLVNQSAAALSIDRITLWSFSQPEKGATRPCQLTLRAHSSADSTFDFTIRSADYQLWRANRQPRLILQFAGGGHTRTKTVVHLVRTSAQEVK
jgi:hypothetical protein